ncbi:MAG: thiamine phosphate synthase, partial [Myxococcales bacterium]|nr:thiamine phosphate synthase [Myxococcales bacterium]
MTTPFPRPGLYAILDLPHAGGLDPAQVAAVVSPYASALQLRAKRATTAERVALLRRVAPRCAAPVIVNDDIEAALAGVPGVQGLHLGHEDLCMHREGRGAAAFLDELRARATARGVAPFYLGLSTHTLDQVERAASLPVDYLGFGPIHATPTKGDTWPEVGLAGLARACAQSPRPVVAIGGLDGPRGRAAIEAGAACAAVISALVGASLEACATKAADLARALAG